MSRDNADIFKVVLWFFSLGMIGIAVAYGIWEILVY